MTGRETELRCLCHSAASTNNRPAEKAQPPSPWGEGGREGGRESRTWHAAIRRRGKRETGEIEIVIICAIPLCVSPMAF